ncbi:MAG: Gfo/Idh/MocA family oxidoreductase [Bacteroidales bacterium]|nr:Gfo/Idh/MocA family oxidoreductase [Bacteroidales bacterium]MBN2634506.1 Gfo/Idh/MocA family oxidoreductase [Bacteroidales bacterium]
MISWGIIGCGNVTEVKSGPAFNKVKDSRLAAVMRRNAGLAEDYAKRHNVPKFYSDASELINDPEVNAVYVATPPSEHAPYALMSIDAGKPVYIEKPMALNYEECVKINDAAEKKQVPVFVAYYRRALPGFVMVKEMIEAGKIGTIRAVHLQLFKAPSKDERDGKLPWRVDPKIAGGGHFYDLASHQLDYLDFVFGPVKEIKSVALNQGGWYQAEDYVSAAFMFDKNIAGTGIWCFNAHESAGRDIIEIIGDRGYIRFSCFTFDPIIVETEEGRKEYVNERPEHVQFFLIQQVVRTLTENIAAASTGLTAARTSRVMEEMVKGYYKGFKV